MQRTKGPKAFLDWALVVTHVLY